jgi:protein CpxP
MMRFETNKPDSYVKYGIRILIPAAFVALIAIPLFARADCEHGYWDKAKHSEFFQKHEKELHDKLGLTATQETAWNAFVAKSRPGERPKKPEWSELSKLSTPDRLDRIQAMMKDRQQKMESRVQATKDFYAQLTPDQQKIFDESFGHRHHDHERR